MTELMYIEHPDLFELSAQVTQHGSDAKGVYLVFNQSLFYPQGGGQPADQGKIITANTCYEVFDVRNVDGEVRHYLTCNSAPIHPIDAVTVNLHGLTPVVSRRQSRVQAVLAPNLLFLDFLYTF